MDELLDKVDDVSMIFEAGCGEGEVTEHAYEHFMGKAHIDAFDISEAIITENKKRAEEAGKDIRYYTGDIYDLSGTVDEDARYDLLICSEVLEHTENPTEIVRAFGKQNIRYMLLSVPNEPIWRILNMARGKYIGSLGNTPGHIQHWSTGSFVRMLKEAGLNPVEIRKPLPWTMVLIRKN